MSRKRSRVGKNRVAVKALRPGKGGGKSLRGLLGMGAATVLIVSLSLWGLFRGGPKSGGAAGPAASAPASGPELSLVEQWNHDKPIRDMSVLKDGTMYVMDSGGIQVRAGGAWGKRLELGWETSGWNFLSAGPDAVYFTRPQSPTLYRADPGLKAVKEIPIEGARELTGVAADPDGGVYVADVAADAIFHLDASGKVIGRVGEDAGLKDPRALFLADDGDLYAVDSGLNQVLRLNPDGKLRKAWAGPWERPTLERLGVAKGKVYLNNHLGGGVWIMSNGGKLEGLCRRTSPEFAMPGPAQLTLGADGFLYVGSSGIGKFQLP